MKKKTKILIISLVVILVIAIVISVVLLNNKDNSNKIKSDYSTNAISIMKEYNVYDKIVNNDYSKTVEAMLTEKTYKDKYLEEYYNIDYDDMVGFTVVVNKFLDKNYTTEEINYIISNYKDHLNILLNMEYVNILQFKDLSNFDIEKIERYLKYQSENDYDIATVVTYVNIGLDQPEYTNYIEYTVEEAQNDVTILVNKYHKLADDYEPDDLVSLSYDSSYKLRKVAADAFEKLTSAALLDNVIFYPFSAYRSFSTQTVLYNRYKDRDGVDKADTYSARPGFSEHQTGLALDIRSNTLSDNLTTKDYEWILNNSYKYGFIVRYPKGKENITQFIEEPWQIRYLGVELATKVHDSGLTYEEYYDLYMQN